MAKADKSLVLDFEFEKETPGTAKFKEVTEEGERGKVGSLYIRKEAHTEMGSPKTLVVTIAGS